MTRQGQGGASVFLSVLGAGLVLQALTLASGPLVARMLGPEGRGDMATVTAVSLLCAQLAVGGLPAAVSKLVAEAGGPARSVLEDRVRRWNGRILLGALVAAAGSVVLLSGSDHRFALAGIAAALTAAVSWQAVVVAMLLGEGRVRRVNAVRIVAVVLYVSTIVAIFVSSQGHSAVEVVGVYVTAMVLGILWGVVGMRRPAAGVAPVDRAELTDVSRRSFVSNVGVLDAMGLDQLIVSLVLGTVSLGLYAVAYSVTSLPLLVVGPVAAALLPRLAAAAPADRPALARSWLLGASAVLVVVVAAVQVVLSPAIRLAFGEDFVPAITPARWLIVAWSLLAFRRVLTAIVQSQGRPGAASACELGCAVVLVAAVVTGASVGGIVGASCGLTVAAAVSCGWLASLVSWHGSTDGHEPERVPGRSVDPVA